QIASNEGITVTRGAPISLSPGGSLTLVAPRLELDSDFSSPSGSLSLTSIASLTTSVSTLPTPGISIADGVSFDVSGLWTNDATLPLGSQPTGPTLINGGLIRISQQVLGAQLALGSNDSFLADGGAWVSSSGALSSGKGGSISLLSNGGLDSVFSVGQGLRLEGFGGEGCAGCCPTL